MYQKLKGKFFEMKVHYLHEKERIRIPESEDRDGGLGVAKVLLDPGFVGPGIRSCRGRMRKAKGT